jgi:4-diphosphocytidyl-2-C-methyl-D-erythritol kinase
VPAKINIELRVGPAREDGFHDLHTVFQAVSLYDTVTASAAPHLSVTMSGAEGDRVPGDRTNLAWRAAQALADHAGRPASVALSIVKSIPVAAGLAGGSADAAGALVACDRLWQLDTPTRQLERLAAELGSDVTFALHGRTAVGTGRGERLAPIPVAGQLHWVLAAAADGLSTPAVYAELDRQRAAWQVYVAGRDVAGRDVVSREEADPEAAGHEKADPEEAAGRLSPEESRSAGLLAALAAGDLPALAAAMANDLQPAALALAPYLDATLAAGVRAGALATLVSGSGPSCVFLATDREHALALAESVAASGTCRFAIAVVGGVPGPLTATQ